MIIAEPVLTLSWTMLFEIVCKNTHDPLGTSTFMIIIIEGTLTLTWTTLFQTVSNYAVSTRGPSTFVIIPETVLDDAIRSRLQM